MVIDQTHFQDLSREVGTEKIQGRLYSTKATINNIVLGIPRDVGGLLIIIIISLSATLAVNCTLIKRLQCGFPTAVSSHLECEIVAFTCALDGGGEEVKMAPMAYVPDLVGKVKQLLDQNDRYITHSQ